MKECREHETPLVGSKTKWGMRYACPEAGCTVAWWGRAQTTPADSATRQARMYAHSCFDLIWQTEIMSRKQAYLMIAKALKISKKKCHIGLFNIKECQHVIAISQELMDEEKKCTE